MKKVLLIDDDKRLAELLTEYLPRHEMDVFSALLPETGMKMLRQHAPDMVILDIMLPGKNGFEVCKEIRAESDVPIIMLTARGEVTDRIVGLELGADDYLPKPFEPRELVARMQSIWRREREARSKAMSFGSLQLDVQRRVATLAGEPIDLTTTEYEALLLFAKNPGKVLTRDEIMDALRGNNWESYNRSIDVLMSRLRQKLKDDPKKPAFFKTIWGSGYMFIAAVGDEG